MRFPSIGVLALLLSAGCAAVRPPSPALPASLPASVDLVAALERQRSARTSLRALARFAYDGPDDGGHARQVLLVARPERLRVEVLAPLGPVFVLVTNGSSLAAFVPSEATIYRGRASRVNLQRYAQVELDLADAVDLLLGSPPRRPTGREVVSAEPESGAIKLWREIPDGPHSGAQVVWFNGALQAIATEDRDPDGHVRLRARFSGFLTQQLDMPEHIEIELPAAGRRMELRLQDVEVNPMLVASVFTLPTPPGATEVDLGEAGGAES